MPDPADYDDESEWMSACVPEVEAEGNDHDAAVAQCLSMWEERKEPMNTYQRTCQIERGEGDAPGIIAGTLVTDGEASDGHILSIPGGELPERAPLLFGHDDYTGTGNLGSWTGFAKYKGSGLGASGIKGVAEIEMEGEGPQQSWRDDIAHMIEKKHIGMFSVRWSEIAEPVRRVNLPSDHPAFVDEKKATGRQRWGLYFEKWKMLEGSVVTLGADPAALIGRMQEAEGDVRVYWRRAIDHALQETYGCGSPISDRSEIHPLVAIQANSGELINVERAAWEAMLEEANRRCSIALDLQEDAYATLRMAHDVIRNAETIRSEEEQARAREDSEETQLEQKEDAAPLPAQEVVTPRELIEYLGKSLGQARQRVNLKRRAQIEEARGRVVHDG
jgi:hypothetical protein